MSSNARFLINYLKDGIKELEQDTLQQEIKLESLKLSPEKIYQQRNLISELLAHIKDIGNNINNLELKMTGEISTRELPASFNDYNKTIISTPIEHIKPTTKRRRIYKDNETNVNTEHTRRKRIDITKEKKNALL